MLRDVSCSRARSPIVRYRTRMSVTATVSVFGDVETGSD
jgi:hypothetical protein